MVRRRRATQGVCVTALVLASCLAPAAAALATTSGSGHTPTTHHQAPKNAVVPHRVVCQDVQAEETNQSQLGLALATALKSGHVDPAKRGMVRVLDADLKKDGTAAGALKGAPSKVRKAEQHLIGDVEHVRAAVARSSNIKELLAAFSTLGRNAHMAVDGETLSSWFGSKCPKPRPPAAHSVPPASSPVTSGTSATSGTSGTSGTSSGSP